MAGTTYCLSTSCSSALLGQMSFRNTGTPAESTPVVGREREGGREGGREEGRGREGGKEREGGRERVHVHVHVSIEKARHSLTETEALHSPRGSFSKSMSTVPAMA